MRTPSIPARLRALSVALCLAAGPSIAGEPVTVAFTADQGTGDAARAVLQLVADEGADLLLVQGDLGYGPTAAGTWIENVDTALGPGFPVLLTVGNHENHEWPAYRDWLIERLTRAPELDCRGTPGVKARCTFRGVTIVQTAPGVHEVDGVDPDDGYADYLARELANDENLWRICSWHKNQRLMQVGGKGDEAGWGVYDACLDGGGIVATGHEHSYSRTHLMSDFRRGEVVHADDHLEIGPGRSFAFVSGLGGRDIRPQRTGGHWWASVWSSTQGADHGALFCTFGGASADCRFKDVTGAMPDRFTLESRNVPATGGAPALADGSSAYDGSGSAPATSVVTGGSADPVSGTLGLLAVLATAFARRRAGFAPGRKKAPARGPSIVIGRWPTARDWWGVTAPNKRTTPSFQPIGGKNTVSGTDNGCRRRPSCRRPRIRRRRRAAPHAAPGVEHLLEQPHRIEPGPQRLRGRRALELQDRRADRRVVLVVQRVGDEPGALGGVPERGRRELRVERRKPGRVGAGRHAGASPGPGGRACSSAAEILIKCTACPTGDSASRSARSDSDSATPVR